MYSLLIVDKDHREKSAIQEAAELEGMSVFEATTGKEALDIVKCNIVDLLILDVGIGGVDVYNLCRQVCTLKNTPILIYTAQKDEFIKLFAYNELGVSDYVVKPCSPQELLARARVILRRRGKNLVTAKDNIFTVEGLLIYKQARTLYVDSKEVELTPKEFNLLVYFVNHCNNVLTREQILKDVWGYDFFGGDRTVDTHVMRLRNHLGKYRHYIVTIHRVGYRFNPKY